MRSTLNTRVHISGTGRCLPERIVDNEMLGRQVTGYDESHSGPFGHWVDQVTHIHERRFAEPSVRSSDLALVASQRALADAGVEAKDIGLIVYASFTMSQTLPGDYCRVARDLGATNAGTFNLMAACAGSIYGLGVAYSMVAAGVYEHVLVIGTETINPVINYADPITAILFGDGAGAAVVSRNDQDNGKGMLPPVLGFEYSPHNIHMGNSNIPIDVPRFDDRLLQPGVALVEQALIGMEGGPTVLRRAIANMSEGVAQCLGYDPKSVRRPPPDLRETLDRAWIIPHQANGRILDGMADRLKVAPERVIRTIYRYGNISAASNLIALDHAIRKGNTARELDENGDVVAIVDQPEFRIGEGDLVLMPSIGGGYVMGCIGFVL